MRIKIIRLDSSFFLINYCRFVSKLRYWVEYGLLEFIHVSKPFIKIILILFSHCRFSHITIRNCISTPDNRIELFIIKVVFVIRFSDHHLNFIILLFCVYFIDLKLKTGIQSSHLQIAVLLHTFILFLAHWCSSF